MAAPNQRDQVDLAPARQRAGRGARHNYQRPTVAGAAPCRDCGERMSGPAHPLGRHLPGCAHDLAGGAA